MLTTIKSVVSFTFFVKVGPNLDVLQQNYVTEVIKLIGTDGVVDAVQVEYVDLLTEAVHHVQVVSDPVHRHRDRAPRSRHTEHKQHTCSNPVFKYKSR